MAPSTLPAADAIFKLPLTVVTKVDAGRLIREMEQLDDFLNQSAVRAPGEPTKMPKTSRMLDETIEVNKLNMLHEQDRQRLLAFLGQIKTKAPIMHISFSADPSPLFTQKLITWLRSEIHPLLLLQVGLQPNMGAGCVLRTSNKYFDLSLRDRFKAKGDSLSQIIKGVTA